MAVLGFIILLVDTGATPVKPLLRGTFAEKSLLTGRFFGSLDNFLTTYGTGLHAVFMTVAAAPSAGRVLEVMS